MQSINNKLKNFFCFQSFHANKEIKYKIFNNFVPKNGVFCECRVNTIFVFQTNNNNNNSNENFTAIRNTLILRFFLQEVSSC